MSEQTDGGGLLRAIGKVRGNMARFKSAKGFNEHNAKASIVAQILPALDWALVALCVLTIRTGRVRPRLLY